MGSVMMKREKKQVDNTTYCCPNASDYIDLNYLSSGNVTCQCKSANQKAAEYADETMGKSRNLARVLIRPPTLPLSQSASTFLSVHKRMHSAYTLFHNDLQVRADRATGVQTVLHKITERQATTLSSVVWEQAIHILVSHILETSRYAGVKVARFLLWTQAITFFRLPTWRETQVRQARMTSYHV